jgi:hypothetical protein
MMGPVALACPCYYAGLYPEEFSASGKKSGCG